MSYELSDAQTDSFAFATSSTEESSVRHYYSRSVLITRDESHHFSHVSSF